MQSKKNDIIDYYDLCEGDYRLFWDLDHSLAMHAGFWDKTTKSLSDALIRENEVLAEQANITQADTVLDAGCGVGGSSIFLAERYGCQVKGITLSQKQVNTAHQYAEKRGVDALVSFQVMDFCRTSFPDHTFDVVWGVESVCHAEDKRLFLSEAYRILKPGGRLIIADGFATKEEYNPRESYTMRRWLKGWGVETIDHVNDFQRHLEHCGFSNIAYQDATSQVMPSSKRLYFISFPATLYSKVGEWFGRRTKIQTDNIQAAYYQHTTLKRGLWTYGVFSARKG